eukprot:TRINITY_DN4035_c0_g3_i1.p1 TRINITY_DN4035_c0_g3~~TRINITY_DN4035_c0_g3_i1.p1  ORF type:complete len:115 (+),score=21.00 TRINITY_DN4035_c0_g3_i1:131-475(+)
MKAVKSVAKFIGIESQDAIDTAYAYTDFAFMKKHVSKFDEHTSMKFRNKVIGAVGDSTTKVRAGKKGNGRETFGEELANEIADVLALKFFSKLGVSDYETFKTKTLANAHIQTI